MRTEQKQSKSLKMRASLAPGGPLTIVLIAAALAVGPFLGSAIGQEGDPLAGDVWAQEAKLQAEEPRPREWAGYSVDIAGSIAVVGAPSHTEDSRPGRAFIFDEGPDGWQQVGTLEGDHAGDLFGHSVAVDGNRVVVSAPHGDTPDAAFAGGVYIFEQETQENQTRWVQTAVFAGEDSTTGDEFGTSVALDGDTLVAGAKGDTPTGLEHGGSAYVFELGPDGWVQEAKLVPNDPDERAKFGFDTAVDGNTVLVGVLSHDGQENAGGTAFLFEKMPGGGWEQTTQLWPSQPGAFHRFGYSVSLDGNMAAIGAPGLPWFDHPGEVYIFGQSPDGEWTELDRLEGDGDEEETFGASVDLRGTHLAAGAPTADVFDYPGELPSPPGQGSALGSGAVFLFQQEEEVWRQTGKLMADDRGSVGQLSLDDGTNPATWERDRFGWDVSLNSDHLLVGSFRDDTGAGDETGSAYIFSAGCPDQTVPSLAPLPPPSCLSPFGDV